MRIALVTLMLFLCSGLALAATSGTTDVSATVSNVAPTITAVESVAAQDPTEDSTTTVSIKFTADDQNGVSDLDDSSASVTLSKSGETSRSSTSTCSVTDISSTSANYTCSVDMWYFDGAGTWTINVSVQDSSAVVAYNDSTTFTYNTLKAIKVGPSSISFGSVSIGQTDIGATDDPIIINNTGNVDIAVNTTSVTAYNLHGTTTTTEYIGADQFSVNINDAADGDALINASAVTISNAIISAGNHSVNDGSTGQEYIYSYLETVPSGISAQTYDTSQLGAWVIAVA